MTTKRTITLTHDVLPARKGDVGTVLRINRRSLSVLFYGHTVVRVPLDTCNRALQILAKVYG